MTLPLVNAATWAPRDRITAQQMNTMQTYITRAVDGVNGGDFSPGTTIGVSGAGITLKAGGRLLYNSRSIDRVVDDTNATSSGQWVLTYITGVSDQWRHGSATVVGNVQFRLNEALADGQVLSSVTVRYKGATSGTLPSTMPIVKVWRIDRDGVETQLGSTQVDTSANNAAYTAAHNIVVSGLAHTVDKASYKYFCEVQGGASGGSAIGSVIYRVLTTETITSQAEV